MLVTIESEDNDLFNGRNFDTMGDKTTGTNVVLQLKGRCYNANILTSNYSSLKFSIKLVKHYKVLIILES